MRTKGRRRHKRERRHQVKPQGNLEFSIQRQSLYLQNSPLVMHVTSIYFREKTKWVQVRVWRLQCHTLSHVLKHQPHQTRASHHSVRTSSLPKARWASLCFLQQGSSPPEALSIWSSHLAPSLVRWPHWLWSTLIPSLESRKQFLKSNGKRKTQGDLEDAGPEKRRQDRRSVPCQETCCMRKQHGFPLWKRFLGGRKKWGWGIWNSLLVR